MAPDIVRNGLFKVPSAILLFPFLATNIACCQENSALVAYEALNAEDAKDALAALVA